ncbi:MAG: hydrogenase maturation protease [Candidatus Eremiobacteraeota bacterium]|nr:hydrogenase maturation protease [Candidatus Eremiobacteraeota bacterium]
MIVGLGNPYRRDDAVGPVMLERLDDLDTYFCQGDPLGLMTALDDHAVVIIVDAVLGNQPGRIHRWQWGQTPPELLTTRLSSHSLPLLTTLKLMEKQNRLPEHTVVYAVEAEDFSMGVGFSPEVEAALPELERRIREEIGPFHPEDPVDE